MDQDWDDGGTREQSTIIARSGNGVGRVALARAGNWRSRAAHGRAELGRHGGAKEGEGATGHGGVGSCRKGTQGDWGGPRAGYEVHRRQRHTGITKGQGEAAWHLPVGLGTKGGGTVASRCRGEAMQSR